MILHTLRFGMILAAASLGFAQPHTYQIKSAADSRLELRVYKTGLMWGKTHLFQFTRYSGTLHFDPLFPAKAHVWLCIDASSAELKDNWLNAKDFQRVQRYAVKDMLKATEFPMITFESTLVRPIQTGFEVQGTLTIRGISKPATIAVQQNEPSRFSGESRIRLTDYALRPPSAALGAIGTQDEMDFSFTLTATREGAP